MRVIRHYVGNDLRNYNYVLGCDLTGDAVAIDPLDARRVLEIAEENGWRIRVIINTHEHHDHIGGNSQVKNASGASVWAHEEAIHSIPDLDRLLKADDLVEVGSITLRVLHTPGHTRSHLCLISESADRDEPPHLFSGDTLFNASAGNCRNGGDVDDLYQSFRDVIASLDDRTLLYPGHDYLHNNLNFALSCDPLNTAAAMLRLRVHKESGQDAPVMTLAAERSYNPFLRLSAPRIRAKIQAMFPAEEMTERDVFKRLRALRDNW